MYRGDVAKQSDIGRRYQDLQTSRKPDNSAIWREARVQSEHGKEPGELRPEAFWARELEEHGGFYVEYEYIQRLDMTRAINSIVCQMHSKSFFIIHRFLSLRWYLIFMFIV